MELFRNRPIGVFDSGFGGLTVMKEMLRHLPHESFVYLGDTAHLPYGNKSPEAILGYSLENSAFLLKKKIKLLVIACHTACCHALETLREKLPIPVIGVTAAGADLLQEPFSKIAILGTSGTIGSGIYQSLAKAAQPKAHIYPVACPLFVPLIEEGFAEHPAASLIAESYLGFLRDQEVGAALLACTHYPLLRPVIQKTLGSGVKLLEPAERCALQALDLLTRRDLLSSAAPRHEFFATDAPEKFRKFGAAFLGSAIDRVENLKSPVEKNTAFRNTLRISRGVQHEPEKTPSIDRR